MRQLQCTHHESVHLESTKEESSMKLSLNAKSISNRAISDVQAQVTRRRMVTAAVGAALVGALPALPGSVGQALAQGAPVEGKQYRLVQPAQPSDGKARIEVIEFFAYTCVHCAHFEPELNAWEKKKSADVALNRVPVLFYPEQEPYAKLYYALLAMDQVNALHGKIFARIHPAPKVFVGFKSNEDIADFVAANGVDRKKFLEFYNSFGVNSRVQQARRLVEAYRVDGTPALAVGGRFYTAPSMVGDGEGSLRVIDFLSDKIRRGQ
jgi:thiol:disulfide interchange protein DsbA